MDFTCVFSWYIKFVCYLSTYFILQNIYIYMIEPLLSGIVLGLVPVTLAGLFVTAYLQYRRGDQLNIT